jgi:hypothetical protein
MDPIFEQCYKQRPRRGYPYPGFDLYQYTLELAGLHHHRRRTTNGTKQNEQYYAAVVEAYRADPLPFPSPDDVETWAEELIRRVRGLHDLGVRRAGYPSSYLLGPLYHYEPIVRRLLLAVAADR